MVAALLDLDGVFYEGDDPIAGAQEAAAWFQARRIPHLFVTNTTSRSREAIVEKLQRFRVSVTTSEILTPAVAARHWLVENAPGNVALFVPEATRNEFDGLPISSGTAEKRVGAVVIGDMGEDWNFLTLNRAFRLLMDSPQPTLIALGMTRYWRAPDGLRLDTAPFVVALEHATQAKAVVLGKPAAPFFRTALDILGHEPADAVMVGDDIQGDIGAAQKLGLTGVLVRTGKFRAQDLEGDINPSAVIESVADLPAWWKSTQGG